jgi:hypothetical protein
VALTLSNGTTVSISNGFDAAKTISATTNATPGVSTSTAHGFNDGDYVVVNSGWVRLSERVVRVDNATANTFDLEGIDTSNTSIYPAGGGTGSAKRVTGWTQLTQILSSSSTGGEQQFWEGQFLEGDRQIRIPTTKSAAGISFTIADDPTLPGYVLAKQANDDRLPRAVMLTLANGAKLLYNAYISLSTIPSLNVNEPMQVEVTLSLLADPSRYAS